MEYHVYWLLKSWFEFFGDDKYGSFLSQKVDGNLIFTDYWKILLLNFSGMGNRSFFEPKSWWEDDIYWLLKKVLCWNFRWWEIQSFFDSKSLWRDDIYLVYLSFPWYSTAREVCFIVQWFNGWWTLTLY